MEDTMENWMVGMALEDWVDAIDDPEKKADVIHYIKWAARQTDPEKYIDILLYGEDWEVNAAIMCSYTDYPYELNIRA